MGTLIYKWDDDLVDVGCDEAGRGCLAGPVVAAAVVLKAPIAGLNDSKKLTEKQRNVLALVIKEQALEFQIGLVNHLRIDEINILNASIEAMHLALDQIQSPFDVILVDGNRFKAYQDKKHECVIKGDGKYQSIAAASILAKTYRDEIMLKMHVENPNYNWNINKGYPTAEHIRLIVKNGANSNHRMTFGILKSMKHPSPF